MGMFPYLLGLFFAGSQIEFVSTCTYSLILSLAVFVSIDTGI